MKARHAFGDDHPGPACSPVAVRDVGGGGRHRRRRYRHRWEPIDGLVRPIHRGVYADVQRKGAPVGDEDLERMMRLARVAIQDRPTMVSDGNPQEQLARAFDRHADRITTAAQGLREVGEQNNLGPTIEGEAATHNIRLGAYGHERSLHNTLLAQATEARAIATALRNIGRQILRTEATSEAEIRRLIGG